MSDVLPHEVARPTLPAQVATVAVAAAARGLAKTPPRFLRRVLGVLSVGAHEATYEEARAARDLVLTVSAYTRGGSACLPRSIATALVCRRRGVWPDWCVGVLSAPPFTAHAWVEAEGRIVDEPMTSADFSKLFSVPAPTGVRPATA